MGNVVSNWKNRAAANYYEFLRVLLGPPTAGSDYIIIWTADTMASSGRTLFGQKIVFKAVILLDTKIHSTATGRDNFMYLVYHMPTSPENVAAISQITTDYGYNYAEQLLYIPCDSIDVGIAALKIISDCATGKTTTAAAAVDYKDAMAAISAAITAGDDTTIIANTKSAYTALVTVEGFMDQPWYASDNHVYMPPPASAPLSEAEEENYYRNVLGDVAYPEYEYAMQGHVSGAKNLDRKSGSDADVSGSDYIDNAAEFAALANPGDFKVNRFGKSAADMQLGTKRHVRSAGNRTLTGGAGDRARDVLAREEFSAMVDAVSGVPPKDPRFVPYTALIHFQIGSDINDIDRVYGTVAQKRTYPKYTDLVKKSYAPWQADAFN